MSGIDVEFRWRGRTYYVTGGWDSESGSYGGPTALSCIVTREDGLYPRGSKMHPGMIQTGLSRGLEQRAKEALVEAMAEGRS